MNFEGSQHRMDTASWFGGKKGSLSTTPIERVCQQRESGGTRRLTGLGAHSRSQERPLKCPPQGDLPEQVYCALTLLTRKDHGNSEGTTPYSFTGCC